MGAVHGAVQDADAAPEDGVHADSRKLEAVETLESSVTETT